MTEIKNAKITGTSLGIEDHGIMTSHLYLEWDGACIGFGGYVLSGESGIAYIEEILNVVGVNSWEELKGQYVRVEIGGIGTKATRIGNLIKDKWLSNNEFFNKYK